MAVIIYAMGEPDTHEPRYVGKTEKSLQHRLGQHLRQARAGAGGYRNNWLRGLLARGKRPVIWPLEVVVDEQDWQGVERYWIARLLAEGARLTNGTAGGDGVELSSESLLRRGVAVAAAQRRPEVRQKRSDSLRAAYANPDLRQHMREIASSERAKAARAAALRSPEARAKNAAAKRSDDDNCKRLAAQSHAAAQAAAVANAKTYVGFVSPNGVAQPPITNLRAFARDNGLDVTNLAAVYAGKRKSHRGWTVRRQNEQ
jgi:hypothetical protein